MNWDEEVSPPGARGPSYISLPYECGPSNQTDLNHSVFLDPQWRWSIILEVEPDWLLSQGGSPRGRVGALSPGLLGFPFIPMASGVF